MKKCNKCKKQKPKKEFYIDKRYNIPASYCKECSSSIGKAWYEKQKILYPHKFYKYKKNERLKKRYGIDLQEYSSLLKKQKYKCKICGDKKKANKDALPVDHCHKTGKVRGILCPTCNAGLGSFKDSEKLLKQAIKYLKESKL